MTPRIDVSRIADGGSVIRCYHTMVKAMEAICNLDCTYCYNMHKKNPSVHGRSRRTGSGVLMAGWLALLALEFFARVIELQIQTAESTHCERSAGQWHAAERRLSQW